MHVDGHAGLRLGPVHDDRALHWRLADTRLRRWEPGWRVPCLPQRGSRPEDPFRREFDGLPRPSHRSRTRRAWGLDHLRPPDRKERTRHRRRVGRDFSAPGRPAHGRSQRPRALDWDPSKLSGPCQRDFRRQAGRQADLVERRHRQRSGLRGDGAMRVVRLHAKDRGLRAEVVRTPYHLRRFLPNASRQARYLQRQHRRMIYLVVPGLHYQNLSQAFLHSAFAVVH